MPKKIHVILTLNPAARAKGDALVEMIGEHGFELDSHMAALGIITGRISESKLGSISKIPGIIVERDKEVKLAPPDADVQ